MPGLPAWTPIAGNISAAFSTLGCFTVDGMIDWDTTVLRQEPGAPAGLDTMMFVMSFIRCCLPYIGNFSLGQARSVVVCDNATLHHDQMGFLRMLVESRGGKLLYL
jgi:hypothetical protein